MKQAIHHLRTSDPVLSAIIERVGAYGIQFRRPDFETGSARRLGIAQPPAAEMLAQRQPE